MLHCCAHGAGPFQVVAAATVGYERRRWSGTSVRPRNQEGPDVTQREDVTAPTLSFWTASETPRVIPVAQLRHFDRLLFFFFFSLSFKSSLLHLVHTCVDPISLPPHGGIYIVVSYVLEGSLYMYNMLGETFWDRDVNFQVSQTFRKWESRFSWSRDDPETAFLKGRENFYFWNFAFGGGRGCFSSIRYQVSFTFENILKEYVAANRFSSNNSGKLRLNTLHVFKNH